jgi:hypothetical protein
MDQTALTQFSHQSLLPKVVVVVETGRWAVLVDQAVVAQILKMVVLELPTKAFVAAMRFPQWALVAVVLVPQVWTAQQLLSERTAALE